MNSCEFIKHLFVSYCHKNKSIVHKIADELHLLKYELWIDKNLFGGNKLYTEIEKGIRASHVFICFISKDYCESDNCVKELSFAHENRKKILPIMLDRDMCNGVGFLISNLLRFNSYRAPDAFNPWSNEHFERLVHTIFDALTEVCINCSKSLKAAKSSNENTEEQKISIVSPISSVPSLSLEQHVSITPVAYNTAKRTMLTNNIFEACEKGIKDDVEYYISEVHSITTDGQTPLLIAVENGHKSIVEILLAHKADINATHNETSALYMATYNENLEIVELLLNNNADLNLTDDNGCTALHIASEKGNKDIVAMLLKHKANVNSEAENGGTALHAAAFYGHIEVIDLLLKNDADINAKTSDGASAYDIASQTSHKEVTQFLMNYKK